MAKHIMKYFVFLDSNALIGRHWVKSTLFEQIDNLRNEQFADVRFYIPSIVYEEWSRHYIDEAQQHLRSIAGSKRGLALMHITSAETDNIEESDLQASADEILKSNSIYIIETPYDKIDWADLLDRAVRHIPPFQPDSDKGMKDAVFARTIHAYHTKHIARKSTQLVAVTGDDVLKRYLQEVLSDENVRIYATLDDFASGLRLSVDKLSSTLITKAKSSFYTPGDKDSLYYTGEVFKSLQDGYTKLMSGSASVETHMRSIPSEKISGDYSLPDDDSWTALDSKSYIANTAFVKRANGRLHWSTLMTYKQAYALSTQNYDGMVINNPSAVIHAVQFKVNWSSVLRTGQTLSSLKVKSVVKTDESVFIDIFPGIDYEKGITNLTRPDNRQAYSSSLAKSITDLVADQRSTINSSLLTSIDTARRQAAPSLEFIKSIQQSLMPFISNAEKLQESIRGALTSSDSSDQATQNPKPAEDSKNKK